MPERVRLRFYRSTDTEMPVCLRMTEVTGDHELSVRGVDTESAVRLLSSIVNAHADRHDKIEVDELTASDRDALLASLHRACWGDRIVSTLHCERCEAPFDLSFHLSELQQHLDEDSGDWRLTDNATLAFDDAPNLAIPVSSQETALTAHSEQEALTVLATSLGIPEEDIESAAERLGRAAPIIDVDFVAPCPECSTSHKATFDVQSFVLQRLLNEREQVLVEIHLIASNYAWPLSEITALPRGTRKSFAQLLDSVH